MVTFHLFIPMLTLQVPSGVKTLLLKNSILWLEDDILFSRPAESEYVQLSRSQMEEDYNKLRAFVGPRKVCMLAETHPNAESPHREDRDYISERLHELITALAIITPNAVSRMVANLFFLFKPPAYPTKMFVNVSDAKKWLENCKKRGPATLTL